MLKQNPGTVLVHNPYNMYSKYLYSRKVRPRHIPAVKFETETIPRLPCSDWRDATILVMLLIYPSPQGSSSSANSISKFLMSANFVSNSANLLSLSKLCHSANLSNVSKSCQQFSKFVFHKKIIRSPVWKIVLSAIQQISKSAIFLLTKHILILVSKSCQQFSKSVSRKQIVSAILSYKQILLQTSAAWL